jgi:hypothetical protein
MNDILEAGTGIWFQPFVVHPGVLAGAKRGRRICFVAFTLTFAVLTATLRVARLSPLCGLRLQ